MLNSRSLMVRAAVAVAAVVPGMSVTAQAQAKTPKIVARPRSMMVNTTAALKGSGFAANTVIELIECGHTFWLAPSYPCSEREQAVTTDRHGRFRATFQVGLCPEGEPGRMPTERSCYVGELVSGEDTGSLVGAAKITVSYP